MVPKVIEQAMARETTKTVTKIKLTPMFQVKKAKQMKERKEKKKQEAKEVQVRREDEEQINQIRKVALVLLVDSNLEMIKMMQQMVRSGLVKTDHMMMEQENRVERKSRLAKELEQVLKHDQVPDQKAEEEETHRQLVVAHLKVEEVETHQQHVLDHLVNQVVGHYGQLEEAKLKQKLNQGLEEEAKTQKNLKIMLL